MFEWNDGNLRTLRNLWGGHSATRIAEVIGNPSRNSVLGKAHRLGLMEKRSSGPPKPRARSTPFRKGRSQRFREVLPLPTEPAQMQCEHIFDWLKHKSSCTLMELSHSTCRWPLWSDAQPERLYCGADGAVMENKLPYCPVHSRMAYRARAAA